MGRTLRISISSFRVVYKNMCRSVGQSVGALYKIPQNHPKVHPRMRHIYQSSLSDPDEKR